MGRNGQTTHLFGPPDQGLHIRLLLLDLRARPTRLLLESPTRAILAHPLRRLHLRVVVRVLTDAA